MDHSPEQIGSSPTTNTSMGKITRRGFIATSAATMASCKAASSTAATDPNAPIKSTANKDYRTPSVDGPTLRNNAGNPSSNFSKDAGVTFSRVLVSGNYCAITFDDGPHPQNTPRLLDMLAQRNIKATFYVIGRSVNLHPGVLRRTVAEGHEIGNHSHTHRLLSKLGDSEVRKEMQLCQDAIAKAAGVRPRTMRPPYGGLLQRQRELILKEFGYPTILWSVDPLDWKRPGPSVVASRILSNTTAGGIVLAHDLHSQTVDAMPATLDGLLKKGFKFVTVSQLIAMKVDAGDAQASVTPTS
ncbi:MAG: polysaccharide deacetylase family protein [Luteolibacter sp.]